MSIQFFDCPNCGKSLRVGARKCHHCHAVEEHDWRNPDAAPEFATGGYAEDEDDVEGSTADRPLLARWKQGAFVVIVLLLILSFILQAFLPSFSPFP